ncbi:hypothetical protein F8388_003414 [Cannabis sativa]|uniref:Reverse transcriptase zinc-binding domain-containing protein n=1 Tax=Cannabis sativa TaxID=3483 RepID=A0A7J6DX20_CANSA|nr:hypothetical protein F8388_003414 [Cannabis sativa]
MPERSLQELQLGLEEETFCSSPRAKQSLLDRAQGSGDESYESIKCGMEEVSADGSEKTWFGSALSLSSSLVFEGFPFSGIEVISSAMDEILKKTHNLQVTDEDEEWEVDKSLSITIARYNLRGQLCTNSDHSRGFLKKVLGGIWRLKDGEWNIKIKEKIDLGLFLSFTFASESIQRRILSKMPWYLSNGVLILGKMENSNESWKNDLTSFPIWGRAWGVPTDLLTTKNTTRMAAKAGEVISVYNSDVDNGGREGIMGNKQGKEMYDTLEEARQAPTTNPGRNIISNSVPMRGTMEVVSTGSLDYNQLQQNMDKSSQYSSQNASVKAGNDGKEDVQSRSEDGSRGKRRIVEDYGDSEYGKLKKSATILAKETQDQNLYNVPVSYTQDALVLNGSTPFAVGSSSKNIAKETRRKFITWDGNWNMAKIDKHFHKDDISWIQGIPIDLYMEDTLIWPFTPNGQYIVKSGYRVGREMNLNPTRCSNMTDIQKWWKMIWSLHLPPRMKLFGWRVCHNWLPAKMNLKHRGMEVNTRCELCARYDETLTHALWSCDKVKSIWKLLPWYKQASKLGEGSMFDILKSLEQTINRQDFEDAIKILWAIWENRNRKWNQLPCMNRQQLLNWVFSAYPNGHTEAVPAVNHEADLNSHQKKWIPPASGSICVNCDAAVVDNTAGVGIEFIWRKADGQMLSAGMRYLNNCCSPKTAEAWALWEALNNLPATETSRIEVQSDCRLLLGNV